MNRRDFLAGCIPLAAAPFIVKAQQRAKVYRIGSLTRGDRDAAAPYNRALEEGLRTLGWIAGDNVVFQHRYADLKPERYPELAAELVRLPADIIIAPSTPAALAVRQITSTIPIVMTVARDPVGAGLVASLARPGGNVTGLAADAGPELGAKVLQLLKEAVPKGMRLAVLRDYPLQSANASYLAAMDSASGSLGVSLYWIEVHGPTDLKRALGAALRNRPDGLVVALDPMTLTHAGQIADFAAQNRLPTIARAQEFAENGGLMAYSPDIVDLYRRSAIYVDKILKGTKPAELPVEQPTRFELVINMKTAKQLGVTIPASLQLTAARVIG